MSSRPRVIRKVTKMGRDGRPKVVRDRRIRLTMERVTAQSDRTCAAGIECRRYGLIERGREYAKITYPPGSVSPHYSRYPTSKDYHYVCVPSETRPMLRFLVGSWPGPWKSSVTP